MWIERKAAPLLSSLSLQFPSVILTGARQTGKTSFLRHSFPNAQYISFDDPLAAMEAENQPAQFLSRFEAQVILDEVQYVPNLFRHLKIAIDKGAVKGRFLLTGSQHIPLMQNLSETLAGRCGVLSLSTLSAAEVQAAGVLPALGGFIMKGGYPALYADPLISFAQWFPSYMVTYLERDVRNILRVGNLRDFSRFVRALAARCGRMLSLSDLARDVGVAPNTVKSWISVLEASGIVFLLEPFHRNMSKRLVKSPKVYFMDTGLAANLMGLSDWDEAIRTGQAGPLWETYIFGQIQRHLMSGGSGTRNLWFWRTSSGDEVDFLVEQGGSFTAIECKLTETPELSDLKAIRSLERYYGTECVRKVFLACPVSARTVMGEKTVISNFVDESSI